MTIRVYWRTALTGGGAGALDGIPRASLANNDRALAFDSGESYSFLFDATSSAAENVSAHPFVVEPDDAGGSPGRWLERVSVIEQPVSGTPASGTVPIAGAGGDLDPGWIPPGVDADTVDGLHAADFAPVSHSHTMGDITDHPPVSGTPGSGVIPLGGSGGKLPIGWIPSGVDAGYLDGVEVSAAGPASGQALVYSEAASAWVPAATAGSTPDASESVKGIAELASAAEAKGGEDVSRIITPAKLAAVIDDLGLGRNLIINGNFDVWQRGTSFTGRNIYTADRWHVVDGSHLANQVTSRSTDVPSNGKSKYSLSITRPDSDYYVDIAYPLEASVARQLIGRPVTISCWAKKATAETTGLRFYFYSAASEDDFTWASLTLEDSFSFSDISTDWTFYEATINSFSSNYANGLYLLIYTGSPSDVIELRISQVQLELGSHATEFEVRQPAVERILCERYCQVIDQQYWRTRATHYLTNEVRFAFNIPTMRATPTVTVSGTAGTDISLLTIDGSSQAGFTFDAVSSAGSNKHIVLRGSKSIHSITDAFLLFLTTSAKVIIDAEL